MAATLSGLSASVTRILYLTGFPKELKTKDIQLAFSEYENLSGGFKIKWRDDTSLLIVFQDAAVAKRAYLNTLAFPPQILTSSNTGISATIKPYDGPDAQSVIQTVNSRHNPSSLSRSHHPRAASVAVFPTTRSTSTSASLSQLNNPQIAAGAQQEHQHRKHSPTLPSLPSHPTLNALINSSLGEGTPLNDPAILTTSLHHPQPESVTGPRIGDPGKRMLGAALGVRHLGLGHRMSNGGGHISPGSSPIQGPDHSMRDMQRGSVG